MPWRLTRVCEALRAAQPLINHEPSIIEVPVDEAVSMIAAEEVKASTDLPPFDRSAMDGYAVRAEDTTGATPWNPITLRVVGSLAAGDAPSLVIGSGECVEVATGAPLPMGADAVVKLEDAMRKNRVIEVIRPVAKWENVSRRGEDLRAGFTILRRGDRIKPWHVAALASQGISIVRVYSPIVAVFSTGEELVELGEKLSEGRIYCYTKWLVRAWLREAGCRVLDGGIVPDDEELILKVFEELLRVSDAIIATGGTSVGERDYTVKALSRVKGLQLLVHGLALRPGMPTAIGVAKGKLVMATSGLPVAALAALELVFKPLLYKMCRAGIPFIPPLKARLVRRVTVESGFLNFVRVRVYRGEGVFLAEPVRLSGSGVISSLLTANGLLVVKEELEGYDEGEEVEVLMYGEPESQDLP